MSDYTVVVPKKIRKDISRIPLPWQKRTMNVLRTLASNPFLGAPMQGKYKGKYKIRIWPYRVVYFMDKGNKHIVITEAGHRGGMSYK